MDEDEGEDTGGVVDSGTTITDSISCKYKINIFVARVSRDNHAESFELMITNESMC